jgi:hypothetical protein
MTSKLSFRQEKGAPELRWVSESNFRPRLHAVQCNRTIRWKQISRKSKSSWRCLVSQYSTSRIYDGASHVFQFFHLICSSPALQQISMMTTVVFHLLPEPPNTPSDNSITAARSINPSTTHQHYPSKFDNPCSSRYPHHPSLSFV